MANKWIQKADIKKGAFTAWCNKQGYDGVTQQCIDAGKKADDPTTRKRANLAETFRGMAKKRNK